MDEAGLDAAKSLDERGQHDEALKLLSTRARKGDAVAMRSVALRLLFGDNAPHLPEQGLGLLKVASTMNEPVAKAFLAALSNDHNDLTKWIEVVTCLEAKGREASPEAKLQARALRSQLERQPRSNDGTGKLDRHTLVEDPAIVEFPGFLDAMLCRQLIEEAEPYLEPAQIYSSVSLAHERSASRSNSSALFNIHNLSAVSLFVQSSIAAAVGCPFGNLEALSALRYRPGEQFADHYDFLDPAVAAQAAALRLQGQRVATLLIYLNDDFDEGGTGFPKLNLRYEPKAGNALLFCNVNAEGRPDHRVLHTGLAPAGSEKWVCSQFIRARPVLPTGF